LTPEKNLPFPNLQKSTNYLAADIQDVQRLAYPAERFTDLEILTWF